MWSKEQMEAWERLKNKGFKFSGWGFKSDSTGIWIRGNCVPGIADDLNLLFGDGYGVER